jgi:hypothetical protein
LGDAVSERLVRNALNLSAFFWRSTTSKDVVIGVLTIVSDVGTGELSATWTRGSLARAGETAKVKAASVALSITEQTREIRERRRIVTA